MPRDFHIYTLSVVHAEFTSPHRFHANSGRVTTSWQVSNVATRVEGAEPSWRGGFEALQPPGPRRASGSVSSRHSITRWQQRRGHGDSRAYAVYMQFLWTAGGRGRRVGWGGAIKILQINYTKRKKKGKLFIRKICTRPSLRRHHLYELWKGRENKQGSVWSHAISNTVPPWFENPPPLETSTNLRS